MRYYLQRAVTYIKHNFKVVLVVFLIGLLVVSQVRTFMNDGQILGVTVLKKSKQANSVGLSDMIKDETKNSRVCKALGTGYIESLVGKPVTAATLSRDIQTPNIHSGCVYRTDAKAEKRDLRVVSASYQSFSSEQAAKEKITKTKKAKESSYVSVSDLGDEAYYSNSRTHLVVRRGSSVVNVFVTSNDTAINEQEIAQQVSSKLFNEIKN